MPANVCPACQTAWLHVEVYKTVFGSKAQRSANGICPICEIPTEYYTNRRPFTEEELDAVYLEAEAQRREDAFERWYADHEANKLRSEFDRWLTSGAV